MMAIFFALISAVFIGMNAIVIKRTLGKANAFTVAAVLTFMGMVFFWILSVFTIRFDAELWNPKAIIPFAVAGVFAPGLVRWIFFTSIDRVGTAVSSSMLATIPAFAVIIAILFLGEKLSLAMAVGLMMIVGGIILFEREVSSNHKMHNVRRKDLFLPLSAAIVGAIAINFRKLGLMAVNSPVLGAVVGFTAASIFYLVIMAVSPARRKAFSFDFADLPSFVAGALSLSLGWLCIFYALSHGQVVLVAPLSSLHPLVVLF
ncbi:MAG: DMT family transporter, partial [Deltaproteobacteria bacterium]|nr:DMT family transporter [Deltaproteobacteria bacterium]